MSKRTLPTCTLTEYKCKSTQPGGCSLSLCLSVQMSRLENNEKKHHRDKELVSRLCVTFYWNRRARRSTVQKNKGGWGGRGGQRTSWCRPWCQRRSSPGHGCPPCQSRGRWRRGGWEWSAGSAGGGSKTREEVLRTARKRFEWLLRKKIKSVRNKCVRLTEAIFFFTTFGLSSKTVTLHLWPFSDQISSDKLLTACT